MAFLDEIDLSSLRIDQSVFHIVGPGDEHFQLLEAFDASPHAAFFLGRVSSVNKGNRYEFLADSPVRTQLARVAGNRRRFQQESEQLATAFNEAHGGSAAVGAFLVLSLACQSGRLFGLLKFEDEKVLSYKVEKPRGGKPRPTFGEIERTFVQNRNALQKAALIRLGDDVDEVCVVDRQNPQRPAAYFEQFLRVRRQRSEGDLTKALIDLTRTVVYRHRSSLPQDAVKNATQRLYDAARSGGSVDGEDPSGWLQEIVGPLPADSPVLKDFNATLKRERLAGESFELNGDAIPAPRNRRVETENGVKLTFPIGLQDSVVTINPDKGEIIIRDQITLNDIELLKSARTHP
jgi:hypothetical protein